MRRLQIMIGLVFLALAPMVYGQSDSKRYVVTLNQAASPAAIEQLAIRYGGRVDPLSSGGARQFAVTMTPSGAQLLGGDPEVTAVVPEATAASLSGRLHPASETYGSDGSSGAYSYDGSGDIVGIGSDTFLYDAEGRLVRATVRTVQEDYAYDAFGNRTSATGATNCLGQSPCATPVTVTPSTNHLGGVSYDDAGSITAASGATYSYDGAGMMTRSIAGSDDRQYVYTADDERIAVRQGVSWNWSVRDLGGEVLREFTSVEGASLAQSNRLWTKDYVWRDGLLLASTDATGTYHYHLDHLGTPRLITDANHVRVAEHAYYPFGAEMSITPHESTEEPMKFTGHERDIVAGGYLTLDYMHARYYSPTVGRFLSVDSAAANVYTPQTWNRYAYAGNNPLRFVDRNGLEAIIFIVGSGSKVSESMGHAALWITSGKERHLVSYGGDQLARKDPRGLVQHYRSEGRTVKAFHLKTTPQQDAAMLAYAKQQERNGYGTDSTKPGAGLMVTENCTTAVCNVLSAGDVIKQNDHPGRIFGYLDAPGELESELEDGSLKDLVKYENIYPPYETKSQGSWGKRGVLMLNDPNDPFRGSGFCDASNSCH